MGVDQTELGTTSAVILGLVGRRPGSGYDIAGFAARSIAHFWPISRSQVYAALSRLEGVGLIEGTHVQQDRRPDKRRYELTDAGARALDGWLESSGYPTERRRDGLLAKLFFAERMTPDQRVDLLSAYRDRAAAYRIELQAIVDRLQGRPESFYGRSTALFGLVDATARIAWAEHMLAVLHGSAEFGDLDLLHTLAPPAAL
ncbi:MAG: PadR family transcriptional regulator [Solirubrobacteraceae bacterium]